MATETTLHYRTKRVALRGPDGRVTGYLRLPDKSDPAFQAETQLHLDRLNTALDQAAQELGISREELVDRLVRD